MSFSFKRDWVYVVLGVVGVLVFGWVVNWLWSKASTTTPGASWFNRLFHGTKTGCAPVASGSDVSKSECCGPVPASAAVCCGAGRGGPR